MSECPELTAFVAPLTDKKKGIHKQDSMICQYVCPGVPDEAVIEKSFFSQVVEDT